MDYPREFAAEAINRIEDERLKAKRDLQQARTDPLPKGFTTAEADKYELWRYILRTVLAFGHEACELVKQRKWTKAAALREMIDFRRRFAIEARREIGCDRVGRDFAPIILGWMAGSPPGTLQSDVERDFNNSAEWQECEAELLAVTGPQAAHNTEPKKQTGKEAGNGATEPKPDESSGKVVGPTVGVGTDINSIHGIAKGAMTELPQEISGDLRNSILAGLLHVQSGHLEGVGLTECLRKAYDVYAEAVQRAGWPLTESLLIESIPAWVFQWGVARGWLPYPPHRHVPGRGNPLEGRVIPSSFQPIPESELTVQFGCYKVTDWYKADVLKRLGSRIAHWQSEALVSRACIRATLKPAEQGDIGGTHPTPEEGANGLRKRGPKPDHETARRIAEIVAPYGDWRLKLDDVCESLDQAQIPFPRRWRKDKSCRGWKDYTERANAVKAIEYRLEIVKQHK
jgi:hypothetical protein